MSSEKYPRVTIRCNKKLKNKIIDLCAAVRIDLTCCEGSKKNLDILQSYLLDLFKLSDKVQTFTIIYKNNPLILAPVEKSKWFIYYKIQEEFSSVTEEQLRRLSDIYDSIINTNGQMAFFKYNCNALQNILDEISKKY